MSDGLDYEKLLAANKILNEESRIKDGDYWVMVNGSTIKIKVSGEDVTVGGVESNYSFNDFVDTCAIDEVVKKEEGR